MDQSCPERCDTCFNQEVVLYQSDYDHSTKLKNLLTESWNAAVLDSGVTNTVAGEIWFKCYNDLR